MLAPSVYRSQRMLYTIELNTVGANSWSMATPTSITELKVYRGAPVHSMENARICRINRQRMVDNRGVRSNQMRKVASKPPIICTKPRLGRSGLAIAQ